MADQQTNPQDQSEPAEQAEPLNRAERRAQQRGKKTAAGAPSKDPFAASGHRDQVQGQQRRAGRRGNR
jgi:hypothetical protein